MNNRKLARFPLIVLAVLLPLSTTAAFAAAATPAAQTQRNQGNQTQQPGLRGGPQGQTRNDQRGPDGGPRAVINAAVAKALGLTPDTLRQQVQAGKTVADLAKAKGVSTATIRTAALAALKTQLAADVKAGKLTQAQADQHLARATANTTLGLMAGSPHDGGHRDGRGGLNNGPDHRPAPGDRAPSDRPAPAVPRGDLPTDGA